MAITPRVSRDRDERLCTAPPKPSKADMPGMKNKKSTPPPAADMTLPSCAFK